MTEAELMAMGQAIVTGVRQALQRRDERIAALEQKIIRLEALLEVKNFAYLGVWRNGKVYHIGSFVTHDGGLWHCNQFHTTTKPGNGDASWTLAVKAGRGG
jgi:hypothetical protein